MNKPYVPPLRVFQSRFTGDPKKPCLWHRPGYDEALTLPEIVKVKRERELHILDLWERGFGQGLTIND